MTADGLIQRWRRWLLACRGVDLDRSCTVGAMVSLGPWLRAHAPKAIQIGPGCELCQGVELNPWGGSIRLGRHVFVGPYTVVYGHGGVEIGDHVLISMHCSILSSDHEVPSRNKTIRNEPDVLGRTVIGRDVWLGAGVRVLRGVTLGQGAVVGAGSVVTGDLPDFSISVGVPAKVIRYRE